MLQLLLHLIIRKSDCWKKAKACFQLSKYIMHGTETKRVVGLPLNSPSNYSFPGQRPCRSHSNPSPRPTSEGPDYRDGEIGKMERQQDFRKHGLQEVRWTEPEWKHILSVSELSGLCGLFNYQLKLLHWLSSALEGTSHVEIMHLRIWVYTLTALFFLCYKNGRLILSTAIKPSRQMQHNSSSVPADICVCFWMFSNLPLRLSSPIYYMIWGAKAFREEIRKGCSSTSGSASQHFTEQQITIFLIPHRYVNETPCLPVPVRWLSTHQEIQNAETSCQ